MSDQTFEEDVPDNINTNQFTRANADFVGWATDPSGCDTLYADGEEITLANSDSLYAQWNSYCPVTERNSNENGATTTRVDSVQDHEGNWYNVVQIGNQCWLAENMRAIQYADGISISQGSDTSSTTAYWYYPNDSLSNKATYGLLYNWKAVMRNSASTEANPSGVQGICPTGWHVPSNAEWTQLTSYVSSYSQYCCGGNTTHIAKALASTTGWESSTSTCAVGNTPINNNATGFGAMPAGDYISKHIFFGWIAGFSSATEYSSEDVQLRGIFWILDTVLTDHGAKSEGLSVRCVRDVPVQITFDNNNGAGTMSAMDVAQGATTTLTSNTFTRTNCTFKEWNTDRSGCGTSVADGASFSTDTNVTLYAQWHSYCPVTERNSNENGDTTTRVDSVQDHEGNWYKVVQIGNQCWLRENMRATTSPKTGENYMANIGTYSSFSPKAYCRNNDVSNILRSTGVLYNWCATLDTSVTSWPETAIPIEYKKRGICPQGWHIPTDEEWFIMEETVAGVSIPRTSGFHTELNSIQLMGGCLWPFSNEVGDPGDMNNSLRNSVLLSIVPTGTLYWDGFIAQSSIAVFHTSTQISQRRTYSHGFANKEVLQSLGFDENMGFYRYDIDPINGTSTTMDDTYSVRCVRDTVGSTTTVSITFDNNNGAGTMSAMNVAQGATTTLSSNTFTRTNCTFKEWNTDRSGCGTAVADGASFSTDTNVTLYAQWHSYCPVTERNSNENGDTTTRVDSVQDHEGNWYDVVQIGSQCWLKENMRATTDPRGNALIESKDKPIRNAKAYYTPFGNEYQCEECVSEHIEEADYIQKYGVLYNWLAAADGSNYEGHDVRGICPEGWHLPYNDIMEVSAFLNGSKPGQQLAGGCDWGFIDEGDAESQQLQCGYMAASNRNILGANLVPGGVFVVDADEDEVTGETVYTSSLSLTGFGTAIWSSHADRDTVVDIMTLMCNGRVDFEEANHYFGLSVRCVRDAVGSTTVSITFDNNNGAGTMSAMNVAQGATTTLTSNTFTRTNCTFKEWNTERSGCGTSVADGASFSTDTNVTLYAQWHSYCPVTERNSNENGDTTTRVDSVQDHEGNWYDVVQIGSQCWLKENMRATTEPGSSTSIVQNPASGLSDSEQRAFHYNDSTTYSDKYGLLYNFPAMMNITDQRDSFTYPHRGICPEGWHVPQDSEWSTLAIVAGCSAAYDSGTGTGKLTGGCDWNTSSDATAPGNYSYLERNSSGFSALPAGYFDRDGFANAGIIATFRSATLNENNSNLVRYIFFGHDVYLHRPTVGLSIGLSVRCVRDNSGLTLGEVTTTDSTATTLTIRAVYSGDSTVTGATICAYTDAECTTPAGTCAAVVPTSSPITGTITGLFANTQYYVKVIATTAGGSESAVAGPFGTAEVDTITFIANGGSGTMDTMFVTRGIATSINTLGYSHTNWSFTGWKDACDGAGTTYADGANITTNGNVTLYANWHTWCTGTPATNELGSARIDSVKDHEDNWYKVVQIGSQCWLAENMRATTEPGSSTSIVQNPASGLSNSEPRAYRYNDSTTYSDKYGLLYNFPAAMNITDQRESFTYPHRGICPKGWHVPQESELDTLVIRGGCTTIFLSGTGVGKLTGGCDWSTSGSTTAPGNYSYSERNSSGFSALPAGRYCGSFDNVGYSAFFWSSTPLLSSNANYRAFSYSYECLFRGVNIRNTGFSVRCVRDNSGITLGAITKTDSTATTLTISVDYSGDSTVTGATICAYTDAECTTPAGTCATGVNYASSPITGTVTDLTAGTQYYVKVIATTAGGSESAVAGPFGTAVPSMAITSNPASASVGLCGQTSVEITYTANLTGATASSYSWSVSGGTGSSTTSTITVTATEAGTISVTCTAAGVSATKSTIITSGGTAATLGLCEDYTTPSVTISSTNCTTASLVWKNSSNDTVLTGSTTLQGVSAGYYTVTGVNSSNCAITRTVRLGNTTLGCPGIARANETASGGVITQVRDHQDHYYNVVSIGGFCIMKQNLRCTTSPNPSHTLSSWGGNSTEVSCYIQNTTFGDEGYEYNWRAALDTTIDVGTIGKGVDIPNRRGLCPQGWHLPTRSEWESIVGCHDAGQFAAANTDYTGTKWESSSTANVPGNTSDPDKNATGFSGVPVGYSDGGGSSVDLDGYYAYFWSATSQSGYNAYIRDLHYRTSSFYDSNYNKRNGCSVRCVRDE